jgi:hypothetical protein
MCYARIAASQINAYCRMKWPEKGYADMASTWANGSVIDAYDHVGGGSHKYIPADDFTKQLGEPIGAGVFSYWQMKDGSLLLRTCKGPLAWAPAYVEGEPRVAQWGEFA